MAQGVKKERARCIPASAGVDRPSAAPIQRFPHRRLGHGVPVISRLFSKGRKRIGERRHTSPLDRSVPPTLTRVSTPARRMWTDCKAVAKKLPPIAISQSKWSAHARILQWHHTHPLQCVVDDRSMRALKNGATPRARLLVVNNAALEQCKEGVCVEGPTGRFIEELSRLLPGVEVAQGLVRFDDTVAPNAFDLSSCAGSPPDRPTVEAKNSNWQNPLLSSLTALGGPEGTRREGPLCLSPGAPAADLRAHSALAQTAVRLLSARRNQRALAKSGIERRALRTRCQ